MRNSLLVLALFALIPTQAQAEPEGWNLPYDEAYPFDITMEFLAAPYYGTPGLGGGIIFAFPILPSGFSKNLSDGFYIELEGNSRMTGKRAVQSFFSEVIVRVRYELGLFDWMHIYFAGGGGIVIPYTRRPIISATGSGGLGFLFLLQENLALRIEGGWPGLKVGLTFRFI